LKFILEKSAVYTGILAERMEKDKMKFLAAQEAKEAGDQTGKKRGRACHVNGSASPVKRFKAENGAPVIIDSEEHPLFEQPALVTGAKLKQYQLEGVQWMVSLDQNGISGILGGFLLLGSLPHRLFPLLSSRRDGPWKNTSDHCFQRLPSRVP